MWKTRIKKIIMSFTETVIFMGMIKIPHFLPQIHILHSILELQDGGKNGPGKVEIFLKR
jgi:hypothetical protein